MRCPFAEVFRTDGNTCRKTETSRPILETSQPQGTASFAEFPGSSESS
jgi:hypothetical protein